MALTPEQRRAIKESPLSYRKLAEILHVNVKTIAKWKHSRSVYGRTRGPEGGKSRSLTIEDAEGITYYYAASGKTIDQCLKDLVKTFPLLTRSTYYRCIRRVRDRDMGKFNHLRIMAAVSQVSQLRSPVDWSSNDDD